MSARDRLGGWLLPLSLLLALLLGLLPLHAQLQPLRPYWLALVLAYWVIETPSRAGLGLAFACGLVADLAYGILLLQTGNPRTAPRCSRSSAACSPTTCPSTWARPIP